MQVVYLVFIHKIKIKTKQQQKQQRKKNNIPLVIFVAMQRGAWAAFIQTPRCFAVDLPTVTLYPISSAPAI